MQYTEFADMLPDFKDACEAVQSYEKKIGRDDKILIRPVYKKENGNWHVAIEYDQVFDVAKFFWTVGGYMEAMKQEEND